MIGAQEDNNRERKEQKTYLKNNRWVVLGKKQTSRFWKYRVPRKRNTGRYTTKHKINMSKVKNKQTISKQNFTYKGNPIRLSTDTLATIL